MKNITAFLALALFTLATAAPARADEAKPAVRKDPVQDTATELHKRGFNTFLAAAAKTDFVEKLMNGTYTVVAPTDVAFRDLPKAELDALLADQEKLTKMLSNHIIAGKVTTADLKAGKVKTLGGTTVQAKTVDGKLKIGTATVVRFDIPSSNGVIHGVDKFLQP